MKIFNSTVHGYLDYLTVLFFFLAPSLFSLSPWASTIAYLLAGVHLALTLITEFRLGLLNLVPVNIHGTVELVVSIVLMGGPWIINGIFVYGDRLFFTIVGAVIFLVWLLTEYTSAASKVAPAVYPESEKKSHRNADGGQAGNRVQ